MSGAPEAEDPDLRAAAGIFLRGPVPVGSRVGDVEIGPEAIGRVAAHLARCSPDSVTDIRTALAWHRRVGTTASRQAVIDEVTAAVALPDRGVDRQATIGMRDAVTMEGS